MQTWVHNRHPWKSLKSWNKKLASLSILIGGTVIIFLISPILWALFIYWLVTRAYIRRSSSGWVLYISLFNLSISNALGLYLSMIAVFRRRYYELLLYALLNPIIGSCTQSLLTWLCGNFYKTLLLGKTLHGISKLAKLIYRFRLKPEQEQPFRDFTFSLADTLCRL